MTRRRPPSTASATAQAPSPRRRMRGFEPAASLLARDIRKGAESRGFAVTRLLTHWAEIVGPDLARATRPVKVTHGKSFGATLTLLVRGAEAPLIQMQLDSIRDRVNACYGFNAVTRVAITQTAATGFAEGQAQFGPAPARAAIGGARAPGASPAPPDPRCLAEAEAIAARFADPALATAMRGLALNLMSRRDASNRKAKP